LEMSPVHWVIQENQGDSENVRRMMQALEVDGHVAHLVCLTNSLDIPPIQGLPDEGPIVCHGQGFITRALHHPRLKRGLFFNPDRFRWEAFRSGWEGAILSSDGRVMTLSEARDFLKNGAKAFIRPDADSKVLLRRGLRRFQPRCRIGAIGRCSYDSCRCRLAV
jgi:hypothetical protein